MESMAKLKIENVTKIFGKNTKKAIQLLNNGESKKDILKKLVQQSV